MESHHDMQIKRLLYALTYRAAATSAFAHFLKKPDILNQCIKLRMEQIVGLAWRIMSALSTFYSTFSFSYIFCIIAFNSILNSIISIILCISF